MRVRNVIYFISWKIKVNPTSPFWDDAPNPYFNIKSIKGKKSIMGLGYWGWLGPQPLMYHKYLNRAPWGLFFQMRSGWGSIKEGALLEEGL